MGATPGVTLPHTVGYLRGRAVAAPAVLGLLSIHGAYRGLRDTITPLRITVAANVVNLVLDPVLIFGAGLGAAGAALATSASQVLALGFLLRRLVADGLLRPADMRRVRPRWWGPLLRAGAALTVRTGAILATVAAAGATAAGGGAVASAAFEITRGLWVLSAMALDSLAHAAQALLHGGALPPAAPDWQRRLADVRGPRRCRLGSPVALTEASCGPTVGRMAARKRPTRCAYTAALAVVKTAASMDIYTWLGL
ncbi:hypothetical protein I4F81_003680 [Pyropia yezoensis]|uniref:Uncharacterized protein n=1 Tax=Pyropia yezoensis TaxID=2788 RepID=A0ACC3BUG2_PYRYE|nr:hypothetical protein I4F81_003680 [Neopyropia yezoensis]